jgi:hypothetical protein
MASENLVSPEVAIGLPTNVRPGLLFRARNTTYILAVGRRWSSIPRKVEPLSLWLVKSLRQTSPADLLDLPAYYFVLSHGNCDDNTSFHRQRAGRCQIYMV